MIRRERSDGGEARGNEEREKRENSEREQSEDRDREKRERDKRELRQHRLPLLVVQLLQGTAVLLQTHEFPTIFCSKAMQQ